MLRLWPSSSSGAASVSCDAIRVSRGSPVRSLDAVTQIISSHVRVVTRISSHVRVVTRVSRAPDTGVRVSGSPVRPLDASVSRAPDTGVRVSGSPVRPLDASVSRAHDTGVRVSGSPVRPLDASGSPVRSLDAVTKIMSSARVRDPVISRSYLFLAWLVCLSILISCAFAALLFNVPFTSSLICFAGFFPGICCSGMSFQLKDPDAKLPKFKTRVATAGMTYFLSFWLFSSAVSPSCPA